MASVFDRIPLTPIFPKRPKDPRRLARAGAKMIEQLGTASVDHLREGIVWIEAARELRSDALPAYELYNVGIQLLSTAYLEAHIVGLQWCAEAREMDPEAVAKADREIDDILMDK